MVDPDAVFLVSSTAWFAARAESEYHEIEPRRALWLLQDLDRSRMMDARYFAAEARLGTFDIHRMRDDEVLRAVGQSITFRRVITIQKGGRNPRKTDATVELRQLAAQVEQATRGKLSFRGRQYKLVVDIDLAKMSGRDYYEVVPQAEARAILDGTAKESPYAADHLAKALDKLSKDWRAPFSEPEGLVLLRRISAPAAAAQDTSPAITPSEMKKLLKSAPENEPEIRLVNTEAPVFVPGVETIRITYAIDGPVAKAASVKMIVTSVPARGSPSIVQTRPVEGPYSASGSLDWSGEAASAGGYITLKGSPYEIAFELTSKSGKVSTSGTGKVAVELKETRIVVDPTGPLPVDDDWKATVAALVRELEKSGMPGDCEGRAIIESPLFKTNDLGPPLGDMYGDASFETYEAWADTGPALPFLAQVKLKAKDGTGKRFAPALIGTRVLWDFKLESSADLEGALGARGVQPAAKAFMKKVGAHEEATTQPKGASTHMRIGGLRAKSADRAKAGKQWEAGGDWGMTSPGKRDWAAFTACGASAFDAVADSAVYFSAGRMAGDTFRVRAVVDVDETFDVLDEAAPDGAPPSRRSNVVKIVVWRRVPIVGNWIVGATTTPVSIPPLAAEYERAGMLIEPAPGVVPTDVEATWIKEYQATLDGYLARGQAFLDKALARDPQHWPVRYIDFMDYWEKVNSDAGFFGKLWERIKTFFGGADEQEYKKKCDAFWPTVVKDTTASMTIPNSGVTAIKFGRQGPHNQNPIPGSFTAGMAPVIAGTTTRTKAVFFQFTSGADTGTFIHEVAHTLFLAHAPGHFEPSKQPSGYVPAAHDKDQICLMSYHPAKTHLCGLCLLKLGGRKSRKINNDGTVG